MKTWKKATKRHALGDRYDYFIQLSRSRYWRREIAKEREFLQEMFGNNSWRVDHHWARRPYDPFTKGHIEMNPDWFIDRERHRVWISEKARVLMELMQ